MFRHRRPDAECVGKVIGKIGNPKHSGSWHAETQTFLHEKRDALIADVIGFLRRPVVPLPSHTRWGRWESEVLARLPNATQVQQLIRYFPGCFSGRRV